MARPVDRGDEEARAGQLAEPVAPHRQGDDGHRRGLDLPEGSRGGRREVGEEPGRGVGRHRQDDRVGLDGDRVGGRPDDEAPASVGPLEPPDDGTGAQQHAARAEDLDELAGQPAHPTADAGERRPPGAVGRRRALRGRGEQRASADRPLPQDGHRRVEREPVGVAGVDPAEQRLDEPVDDGPPQPARDVLPHRHVAVDGAARPGLLRRRPLDLGVGEDSPGRRRVGGHPHEGRAGHRVQGAAAPHRRGRRGRGDEVGLGDPDPACEVEGLRTGREQGLGADVDEQARDRVEAQLAAEPVTRLEQRDVGVRHEVEDLEGRGETGDTAPDDGDVRPGRHGRRGHGLSVSRAPWAPGTGPVPIRDRIETHGRERPRRERHLTLDRATDEGVTVRTPSRPTPRLAGTLAAGLLALTALGACSSADSGSSADSAGGSSGTVAEAPADARQESLAAPDQADAAAAPGAGQGTTAVAAAVAERKLARRADVALRVDDVTRAASTLRTIAARAGGLVVSEEVSSDPGATTDASTPTEPPAGWGTVTVSVPTEKLDATLDEVAKVGTVLSRQSSTDDVTARYVDTAARVETMKASVERVRALMGRADKLADIVSLEAELSRRQADLESMEQQLAALDDQVSLSPITVRLSTDGAVVAEDPTGFLAGLASGWAAFTTSVRLVLTLLGALLPFAVAGALVIAPVVLWWRRRPQAVPAPAPAAPVPPAPSA